MDFTKLMHEKWIERCINMNKWEINQGITHESKRSTKAQYNRNENEENYKKIKKSLEKQKNLIIDKSIENFLNVTNTSFSYIFSSLFLNIDNSGAVAVETY